MVQPLEPVESLYIRALRALGIIRAPGSIRLGLPTSIQPVQIIGDFSDFSRPHSNPVFGIRTTSTAGGVGNMSGFELIGNGRALRLRQVELTAGTDVRLSVVTAAVLTTIVTANSAGQSLGPEGGDTVTSTRRTGHSVGFALGVNPFQLSVGTVFVFRPPLLIAPGQVCVIQEVNANTAISFNLIWEEIPRETETENQGFPLASS